MVSRFLLIISGDQRNKNDRTVDCEGSSQSSDFFLLQRPEVHMDSATERALPFI